MYIHEAINARTADQPFIVRASWLGEFGCYEKWVPKILVTNSPLFCLAYATLGNKSKDPCRGWEPSARDLVADDWEITV